jgi:hypothetical protein
VTGGGRKLLNQKIHNLYSSPNIIRMTKSRKKRWMGGSSSMHRNYNKYVQKFGWSLRGRDHSKYLGIG